MGLNWYLQLRNLCKSDAKAAELFQQLQTAGTDDEKENAKQQAQEYIQTLQSNETKSEATEENIVTENSDVLEANDKSDSDVVIDTSNTEDKQSESENKQDKSEKEKNLMDLSAPAWNPRLAKCGITREEELFLKGVYVRKLSHEDKILIRRSIYNKKTLRNAKIQAEYKAQRIAQREKEANDPEKIKFHQERKLVFALTNALEQHKNMIWIFSNIEGLTPEVLKELLQKPGIRNAVRQANPNFIDNFNKKYGE